MALRELLAFFGVDVDTEALKEGDSVISGFVEKCGQAAAAIGAAFAVKEVWEFAKATAETIDHIDDTATALGISTSAVQAWGLMAQSAGDDAGALINAMGRLQASAANSADATSGVGKALADLKVKTHDANGQIKQADDLMSDVAQAISEVRDPAKQAGYAVQIFGRNGRQLLPFLKQGSKGVKEYREELEELGGGYSRDAVEASDEFFKSTARGSVVINTLKSKIAVALLPILAKLVRTFTNAGVAVVKFMGKTTAIQSALAGIGIIAGILAVKMAIAFAPLLLAAAGVFVLYLFFDSLFALFTGKKSLIGDMIDEIFGKGQSAEMVKSIKDAWQGIEKAITTAWGAAKKFFGLMDEELKPKAKDSQGHRPGQLVRNPTTGAYEWKEDEASYSPQQENVQRGEALKFVRGQGAGTARFPGDSASDATTARDRLVQQMHQEDEKKRGVMGNFVERTVGATVGQSGGVGDVYFHQPLNINVTAPRDTDAGDLSQMVARAVQDALDESNRDTLQSVEQAATRLERTGIPAPSMRPTP